MAELEQLLADVLKELRELQHPAFEASLLDGLRKAVVRQESTNSTLIESLRGLHHDMMWLRQHIGQLRTQLAMFITVDDEADK